MRLARSVTLPPACADLARRVDDAVAGFLAQQRRLVAGRDPAVGAAFDELERVVFSGGKRLRPVFCCLGHAATGGEIGEAALRAGVALELLHTFAIVHDDVMDRSRTRRGAPATWVHLADEHRRSALPGEPELFGVSAAVLVGDLAITLADEAFLGSSFPPERLLPGFGRYNRMRIDMVAGQFLDVEAARGRVAGEPHARRVAMLKSGAYTVEGPLHIGAVLGGASTELLGCLSAYGVALGEAFQVRDDVLGVFGDPEVTGKDRDSDLREGKRTVLVAKALAAAPPEDRRLLEERLGRPDLSEPEVERIREVMRATGALDATLALIDELSARARGGLDRRLMPSDVADLLEQMVDVLAARPA